MNSSWEVHSILYSNRSSNQTQNSQLGISSKSAAKSKIQVTFPGTVSNSFFSTSQWQNRFRALLAGGYLWLLARDQKGGALGSVSVYTFRPALRASRLLGWEAGARAHRSRFAGKPLLIASPPPSRIVIPGSNRRAGRRLS